MKKSIIRLFPVLVGIGCVLTVVEKSQAMMGGDLYDFQNAEIILETTSQMNKITQKVSIGEGGKYVKEEIINTVNAFGMKHKDTQIHYIDRKMLREWK